MKWVSRRLLYQIGCATDFSYSANHWIGAGAASGAEVIAMWNKVTVKQIVMRTNELLNLQIINATWMDIDYKVSIMSIL
jgi:hypothetical protein